MSPSDSGPDTRREGPRTSALWELLGGLRIPDHELVSCIGRGSYGEVWLARNTMGLYRAVKIVAQQAFRDEKPFERELQGIRSFEPISRSHEGLVDVLHVGGDVRAGVLYYVMELGDDTQSGQSIDPAHYTPRTLAGEIASHGRRPLSDCLSLGLTLSGALSHLHKHGLIHRDIKPSNIIFVNGVPKLADIGLVTDISQARSYVGTEGYIPPEGPSRPQADVFSLGKVLYEMYTGRDRQEFPELPGSVTDASESAQLLELNEIVLRACHPDPTRRYQSARDLHADLTVLENGKSVRRLRVLEGRLARAKKLGTVAAVMLLIASAVYYQIYQRRRGALEARQRQAGAEVAYGCRTMAEGDLLGALPFFADALRLDAGDPVRESADRFRLGAVLAQCPRITQMWFGKSKIVGLDFSPDGQRLLLVERAGARVLGIAPAATTELTARTGIECTEGYFSPDGSAVAITEADPNPTVVIAHSTTGKPLLEIRQSSWPAAVRYDRAGNRLVTACADGRAYVWDAAKGTLLRELAAHQDTNAEVELLFADFSADGRWIAACGKDHTARLWDANTGEPVGGPMRHPSWVLYASFSADSQRLVTASFDRRARVWQVPSGAQLSQTLPHNDGVSWARFSPDGRYILTACYDSTARLWDSFTGQPWTRNPVLNHHARLTVAAFHPDGHQLVTGCIDGTVRLWSLAAGCFAPTPLPGARSPDGRCAILADHSILTGAAKPGGLDALRLPPQSRVQTAALSDKSDLALVLTTTADTLDPHLRLWSIASGKPLAAPLPTAAALTSLAVSPDGRLAAGVEGLVVHRYDLVLGRELAPPITLVCDPTNVVFDPEGKRLLTFGGAVAAVWDAHTAAKLWEVQDTNRMGHAGFSPNGAFVVTCPWNMSLLECAAQVRRADTGQPVGSALRHRDGVLYASFSHDSRHVVTAGEDFVAIVWEVATGKPLTPPMRHDDQVLQAFFSADDRQIVTAGPDETVRFWNAQTGEPLAPPLEHWSSIGRARLLDREHRLMAVGEFGGVWLWDLPVCSEPAEDLALLVSFLTGGRTTLPYANAQATAPAAIHSAWDRLQDKYPHYTRASANQIAAWYRREGRLALRGEHWAAALFHFDRYLALQPEDTEVRRLRARAWDASGRDRVP